jgi:PAS domain S-box-containing protein
MLPAPPQNSVGPAPRILVVDDERIVAEDIRESLIHMGFEVVDVAQSGADAIEKAIRLHPDLIMMDIVLQGEMDGVEAARIIRDRIDVPCVFLTAYSDPGVLERAKLTEPAGYIVKPFEESGLRSTVEIALYKVKAERALRESREWFSTTLMSISDAVIATTAQGIVEFMNPTAEICTGWSRQNARGRSIQEVVRVFDATTREIAPNPGLIALSEGSISHAGSSAILLRPDHSTISVDLSGAPICNSHGQIIGAVVVFRDVTRARQDETELRQYKDRLEELVNERTSEIQLSNRRLVSEIEVRRRAEQALEYRVNMQDIAAAISSTFLHLNPIETPLGILSALERIGKFLEIDAAFLLDHGQEAKTMALSQLWSADGRAAGRTRSFRDLAAAAFPWWQLQAATQNYIYIRRPEELPPEALSEREFMRSRGLQTILAVPMREGSRLVGFLGLHCANPDRLWVKENITFLQMCSDILLSAMTRKRGEDERELLQTQLAHSQKMEAVGKLSGGIAHDFNNMLLPIIGYSDMLLDTFDAQDPRAGDIAEIRKAAERAATLTRQLLAFSRKQVISKQVFDLNGAITNLESMLKAIIGENISLTADFTARPLLVKADPGQIDQVIMNLVINARDSMPHGGTISVTTGQTTAASGRVALISKAIPRGDYAYIEVCDDGSGMKPELIERIFEPFYTTKGLDGTGLGLSVVYGILEQHMGGVVVESQPGRGSSFTVFLPATNEPALLAGTANTQDLDLRGKGQRILLVEDEESAMKFVSEALRKNGYEVVTAPNIREAHRMIDEADRPFALLFSDAALPDGQGLDFLDEIMLSRPGLRGLLSSGYTDKHAVNGAVKHRAITFLQKPYSLPVLVRTVAEALVPPALAPADMIPPEAASRAPLTEDLLTASH